jgi:hypothetical protein
MHWLALMCWLSVVSSTHITVKRLKQLNFSILIQVLRLAWAILSSIKRISQICYAKTLSITVSSAGQSQMTYHTYGRRRRP